MIDASYFDGQSTRRHAVTVVIHKRVVSIRGAGIHRTIRMSQLDISERLQHAPRILRFPDGAFIEADSPELTRMLAQNSYREPWVVRWQHNWHLSLLALVFLLTALISGYQWGIPWAADKVAARVPLTLAKQLGEGELALLDEAMMKPSKLPVAEQARLRLMFSQLAQPRGEKTSYQILFRDSRIGPNAFAIPNGMIIMTDQMVRLAGDDQAVMGVLAHELGHLQRRHGVRSLLQTVGVAAIVNLWMGDISSVVSMAPAFLLSQKYSRDFERESDQYAIDMLRHNRLALTPMADMFARFSDRNALRAALAEMGEDADEGEAADDQADQGEPDGASGQDDESDSYFSSHPSDAERIARLRAADKGL
jgi:Zn-dependent protease with chaperone function